MIGLIAIAVFFVGGAVLLLFVLPWLTDRNRCRARRSHKSVRIIIPAKESAVEQVGGREEDV